MRPEPNFITRLRRCGRFEPRRNQWYRIWLGVMRNLSCLVNCEQETIFTVNDVKGLTLSGGVDSLIRNPEPMAVLTSIYNASTIGYIDLYEAGVRLTRIRPRQTFILPMGGRLVITGRYQLATQFTTVTVKTIRRCDCSNRLTYGQTEELPIGWQLL